MVESSLSSEMSAVTILPAPSGLSESINAGVVTLSWTNNDDSVDGNIIVQRSADGGSTYTDVATIAYDATSYSETPPSGQSTYDYRIKRETDHASATSNVVSVTLTVTDTPSIQNSISSTLSSTNSIEIAASTAATGFISTTASTIIETGEQTIASEAKSLIQSSSFVNDASFVLDVNEDDIATQISIDTIDSAFEKIDVIASSVLKNIDTVTYTSTERLDIVESDLLTSVIVPPAKTVVVGDFPNGLWDENSYGVFDWQTSPPQTIGSSLIEITADPLTSSDEGLIVPSIATVEISVFSADDDAEFKFGVWEEFSWDSRDWQESPPSLSATNLVPVDVETSTIEAEVAIAASNVNVETNVLAAPETVIFENAVWDDSVWEQSLWDPGLITANDAPQIASVVATPEPIDAITSSVDAATINDIVAIPVLAIDESIIIDAAQIAPASASLRTSTETTAAIAGEITSSVVEPVVSTDAIELTSLTVDVLPLSSAVSTVSISDAATIATDVPAGITGDSSVDQSAEEAVSVDTTVFPNVLASILADDATTSALDDSLRATSIASTDVPTETTAAIAGTITDADAGAQTIDASTLTTDGTVLTLASATDPATDEAVASIEADPTSGAIVVDLIDADTSADDSSAIVDSIATINESTDALTITQAISTITPKSATASIVASSDEGTIATDIANITDSNITVEQSATIASSADIPVQTPAFASIPQIDADTTSSDGGVTTDADASIDTAIPRLTVQSALSDAIASTDVAPTNALSTDANLIDTAATSRVADEQATIFEGSIQLADVLSLSIDAATESSDIAVVVDADASVIESTVSTESLDISTVVDATSVVLGDSLSSATDDQLQNDINVGTFIDVTFSSSTEDDIIDAVQVTPAASTNAIEVAKSTATVSPDTAVATVFSDTGDIAAASDAGVLVGGVVSADLIDADTVSVDNGSSSSVTTNTVTIDAVSTRTDTSSLQSASVLTTSDERSIAADEDIVRTINAISAIATESADAQDASIKSVAVSPSTVDVNTLAEDIGIRGISGSTIIIDALTSSTDASIADIVSPTAVVASTALTTDAGINGADVVVSPSLESTESIDTAIVDDGDITTLSIDAFTDVSDRSIISSFADISRATNQLTVTSSIANVQPATAIAGILAIGDEQADATDVPISANIDSTALQTDAQSQSIDVSVDIITDASILQIDADTISVEAGTNTGAITTTKQAPGVVTSETTLVSAVSSITPTLDISSSLDGSFIDVDSSVDQIDAATTSFDGDITVVSLSQIEAIEDTQAVDVSFMPDVVASNIVPVEVSQTIDDTSKNAITSTVDTSIDSSSTEDPATLAASTASTITSTEETDTLVGVPTDVDTETLTGNDAIEIAESISDVTPRTSVATSFVDDGTFTAATDAPTQIQPNGAAQSSDAETAASDSGFISIDVSRRAVDADNASAEDSSVAASVEAQAVASVDEQSNSIAATTPEDVLTSLRSIDAETISTDASIVDTTASSLSGTDSIEIANALAEIIPTTSRATVESSFDEITQSTDVALISIIDSIERIIDANTETIDTSNVTESIVAANVVDANSIAENIPLRQGIAVDINASTDAIEITESLTVADPSTAVASSISDDGDVSISLDVAGLSTAIADIAAVDSVGVSTDGTLTSADITAESTDAATESIAGQLTGADASVATLGSDEELSASIDTSGDIFVDASAIIVDDESTSVQETATISVVDASIKTAIDTGDTKEGRVTSVVSSILSIDAQTSEDAVSLFAAVSVNTKDIDAATASNTSGRTASQISTTPINPLTQARAGDIVSASVDMQNAIGSIDIAQATSVIPTQTATTSTIATTDAGTSATDAAASVAITSSQPAAVEDTSLSDAGIVNTSASPKISAADTSTFDGTVVSAVVENIQSAAATSSLDASAITDQNANLFVVDASTDAFDVSAINDTSSSIRDARVSLTASDTLDDVTVDEIDSTGDIGSAEDSNTVTATADTQTSVSEPTDAIAGTILSAQGRLFTPDASTQSLDVPSQNTVGVDVSQIDSSTSTNDGGFINDVQFGTLEGDIASAQEPEIVRDINIESLGVDAQTSALEDPLVTERATSIIATDENVTTLSFPDVEPVKAVFTVDALTASEETPLQEGDTTQGVVEEGESTSSAELQYESNSFELI